MIGRERVSLATSLRAAAETMLRNEPSIHDKEAGDEEADDHAQARGLGRTARDAARTDRGAGGGWSGNGARSEGRDTGTRSGKRGTTRIYSAEEPCRDGCVLDAGEDGDGPAAADGGAVDGH